MADPSQQQRVTGLGREHLGMRGAEHKERRAGVQGAASWEKLQEEMQRGTRPGEMWHRITRESLLRNPQPIPCERASLVEMDKVPTIAACLSGWDCESIQLLALSVTNFMGLIFFFSGLISVHFFSSQMASCIHRHRK